MGWHQHHMLSGGTRTPQLANFHATNPCTVPASQKAAIDQMAEAAAGTSATIAPASSPAAELRGRR
jgi:hypothetical protein